MRSHSGTLGGSVLCQIHHKLCSSSPGHAPGHGAAKAALWAWPSRLLRQIRMEGTVAGMSGTVFDEVCAVWSVEMSECEKGGNCRSVVNDTNTGTCEEWRTAQLKLLEWRRKLRD